MTADSQPRPNTASSSSSSSSSSPSHSPAASSWQPPSVPNTVGASFQAWLRPSRSGASTPTRPLSGIDSSSSRGATGSNTPRTVPSTANRSPATSFKDLDPSAPEEGRSIDADAANGATDPTEALPEPSLPQTPMLQAPVKLHYPGKWDELCSQAELYLYNLSTPFFKGAQIGNVFNRIERGDPQTFSEMYNEAQGNGSSSSKANGSTARISSSRPPSPSTPSYQAEERATIGTQLVNGKVASIRWISVDQPQDSLAAPSNTSNGGGWLSWLPGFKVKHRLNVLEVGSPTPDAEEEKVVMLHGYGAGTAFFFQNIEALGSRPNSRLYAIDWLGMGRSSRPNFPTIPADVLKDDVARVKAAESFFVDSLEEWRKKAGVEKMKLIGHSLGGYLSVAYTLRHPTRVSRLVLVSPAGVGPSPDSAPGGTADPDRKLAATDSTFAAKNSDYVSVESRGNPDADAASCHSLDVGDDVEQEIHDPQANMVPATDGQAEQDLKEIDAEVKDASNSNGSSTQLPSTAPKAAEAKKTDSKPKQGPRWGPRTRSALGWLWEQNVSPFGILRTSSFLGPLLMSRYTQRRFGALPEEELKALSAYCQGVFLSKGSGEYCLSHILLPGAWARYPLLHRVAALPKTLPVALAYGESDWMSVSSGREVVKELARNGNDKGRCFVVPHAGHHLYLDNPRAFDRLMEKILDGEADRPAERA